MPQGMSIHKPTVGWEIVYLQKHGEASAKNNYPQLPPRWMASDSGPNRPYKKLSDTHSTANFHVQTCKANNLYKKPIAQ